MSFYNEYWSDDGKDAGAPLNAREQQIRGGKMNNEIMKKLQAPFPASEIEWRVGSTTKDKEKGMALAFVTNRAIQNRLDDVFGVFGWKNEYIPWGRSFTAMRTIN